MEIPALQPHGKGYRIVFEKKESLAPREFDDLYVKVQEDPLKHIDALEAFVKKHPEFPQGVNLLAFAYLRLKRKKEAEQLIEKTYRDHPNYLIAQINYADQLLRKGRKERIPEIFGGNLDLPDREKFHYAEFRGFMVLMGFYHLEIGQKEKAEEYYELAFQVDPLHPSVGALEKKLLKKSLVSKILACIWKKE